MFTIHWTQYARRKKENRGQGPDRTWVQLYGVLVGTRGKIPFFWADTALSQDTGLREQSGVSVSSSLSPGLCAEPEFHAKGFQMLEPGLGVDGVQRCSSG